MRVFSNYYSVGLDAIGRIVSVVDERDLSMYDDLFGVAITNDAHLPSRERGRMSVGGIIIPPLPGARQQPARTAA